MNIFICIDDTDNIDSKGTGSIAVEIAELIESKYSATCQNVTRHQLLIHPDIPYTSHNSSMCFEAVINSDDLENVINSAIHILRTESAEGSDPGLCVFVPERLTQHQCQEIIKFGLTAKAEVLTKEAAYELANSLSIHLSEHGGTGQGIIGALAGVGLRLTGSDGRFKGRHKLSSSKETATVKEILEDTTIEEIRTEAGFILSDSEVITLGDKLKSVFLNHKSVFLVESVHIDGNDVWLPCTGSTLKKY